VQPDRPHATRCNADERGGRKVDANNSEPRLLARHGQNERSIALGRKNHLFAGSDEGGRYWAIHASLIETCKMNDVDPQAWLADVLDKIANRHPMSKIDELLPWAYINNGAKRQAA
jgi:hypothetical protein